MNTENLIKRLSKDVSPVSRRALEKRLLLALATGVTASAVLMAGWLGVRPDLQSAVISSAFLIKMTYSLALAVFAVAACIHLMRPENRPARWFALPVMPVVLLAAFAGMELAGAPRDSWGSLALGQSVSACVIRISIISIPVFFSLIWAARKFAPTRLRAAGAAIGFASGSTAAALYALHCIETSTSFIFLWYSLAVIGAAALGAFVAPLFLRW